MSTNERSASAPAIDVRPDRRQIASAADHYRMETTREGTPRRLGAVNQRSPRRIPGANSHARPTSPSLLLFAEPSSAGACQPALIWPGRAAAAAMFALFACGRLPLGADRWALPASRTFERNELVMFRCRGNVYDTSVKCPVDATEWSRIVRYRSNGFKMMVDDT